MNKPQPKRADTKPAKVPLLAMPADLAPELLPIATEVHRLHENVLWSAQGQFEQIKFWRAMNSVFGVPACRSCRSVRRHGPGCHGTNCDAGHSRTDRGRLRGGHDHA